MDFFSVASGSSGNCICLGSDQCHVMIDAGISGKRIEEGMNTYDYTTSDMDGVLITHEHSDHIKAAGILSRRFDIPLYATEGTWLAMEKDIGNIERRNRKIKEGCILCLRNVEYHPLV